MQVRNRDLIASGCSVAVQQMKSCKTQGAKEKPQQQEEGGGPKLDDATTKRSCCHYFTS